MTTAAVTLTDLQRLWTQPAPRHNAGGDTPDRLLGKSPTDSEGGNAEQPGKGNEPARASTEPRRSTADALAALRHRTPTGKPRCTSHLNRRDWLTEPASNRPGWLRTTCRRCGSFIGYRPADKRVDRIDFGA